MNSESIANRAQSLKRIALKWITSIDFWIIGSAVLFRYFRQTQPKSHISLMIFVVTLILITGKIATHRRTYYLTLRQRPLAMIASVALVVAYAIPLHQLDLALGLLLLLACYDIGIALFITYFGAISLAAFTCNLILYKFGIIRDQIVFTRNLPGKAPRIQAGLGLGHPNFIICALLPILALCLCIHNRIGKLVLFFVTTAYVLITYKMGQSRTSLITYVLFVVLILFQVLLPIKQGSRKAKVLSYFTAVAPWLLLSLSLFVALILHDSRSLNLILSRRPYSWYFAIKRGILFYGISNKNKATYEHGSIDNLYMHLLSSEGILLTLIVLAMISFLAIVAAKEGRFEVCLIILLFLAYGFTERHAFEYGFSILAPILFAPICFPSFLNVTSEMKAPHESAHVESDKARSV